MPKLLRFAITAAMVTAAMIAVLVAATAPARAADRAADRAPTHTTRIVVRPVHANGHPVKGYRVVSEHIAGFRCDGTAGSALSVSKNVYWCGFSATYTPACWKSQRHTVLCLRDPWKRVLVRIRYTGTLKPVAAVAHPMPEALLLGSGNRCQVRDGGAWSYVPGHPGWYGTYSCTRGSVYGPNDGINTRVNPWRVHVVKWSSSSTVHIRTLRVAKAWFVGTAA